ncbi:ROK family protein [Anaerocaecibacter muris]|uniref:ROK family protein n=1 Tax=Anaerocaecibacter muris TaxID=2941513 RepID=UPI00203B48B5|nr:ROK family protein [Anaerocaecibacter muris]
MYCIGIDIGGMSIKAGVVDKDGKIVKKGKVVTDVAAGEHKIINDIGRLVLSLADPNDRDFVGIGIGCPGAINSSTGVVDRAFNLNWHKVALAEELARMINKPIKVSNDANVAALGETMFGVGRMYTDTVFLTIGTGVGGGIVLGGKLYEGNESKGAELGHMVLVVDGEPCSCGRNGCMEAYCSASALIRETKKAMLADKNSAMWKFSPTLDDVDGRTAFECSKAGDRSANAVVDYFVKYLGEGMLNFANIFRPQAIILGGGVCAQGDYLIYKLKDYCKDRNYGFADTPRFDILVAQLGNDAGIIGAAGLIYSMVQVN